MLMSSDDCGVDHRVFVVRIVGQRLEKTLPNTALRPPREPRVNGLPVAEALGQITPRRPRAEFPNHRLNEKSIAQRAIASDIPRTTRQQMFNPCKLIVAQSIAPHRKPPKRRLSMNHVLPDSRIPQMRTRPSGGPPFERKSKGPIQGPRAHHQGR